MLETTVGDGADKLRLQQEIAETSGVDADIGTLLVDAIGSGSLGLFAVGGRGSLLSLKLLVGVVNEILFSRHVGDRWSDRPLKLVLMVDGKRGREKGRSLRKSARDRSWPRGWVNKEGKKRRERQRRQSATAEEKEGIEKIDNAG